MELKNVQISTPAIREACRQSIDYMAGVAAPHIYQFPFPPYYLTIFDILKEALTTERDFSKMALGFPRGFAKTTFLKFVVLWAIEFTKKRNVVIVCANDTLAKSFLADIKDMLGHPNIITIFGNWTLDSIKVTQTEIEFKLAGRLVKVSAVGQGSSLRGMVRDGSRPDFIILDDIQTKEDADSEIISKQLLDWLYGTVNFLRSPFGCTYVFLANMYATPHAILKHLAKDPEWQTYIASAITGDGESLWEQLHPKEQILADYRSLKSAGKEAIFWAELMNYGNLNTSLKYDPEKLLIRQPAELEYHQGCFIIIDPSGRKKTSDDTAIGVFRIVDGIPYSMAIINEVLTPKQTILKTIELATTWGASLIAAEDVAYQETLLFWFEEFLTTAQFSGLNLVGINTGGVSKNAGIIDVMKESQAHEIGFTSETALKFNDQAVGFNPLTTKNKDDILDVHKYAKKVVQQYGHLIAIESPFSVDHGVEIPLIPEQLSSCV